MELRQIATNNFSTDNVNSAVYTHTHTHTHTRTSLDTTAAAESLQSCLTLCDRIDGCPPGSPVPGILQARTLEWVAIAFSNAWKWNVKVKSLSRARLLATPWTAAYQAPLSMDFPGKSTGVGCHRYYYILLNRIICSAETKEEEEEERHAFWEINYRFYMNHHI